MTKILYDYYTLEYHPDHPRAVGDGWVPQQIVVMESHLDRQLFPDEDVKHLNGNVKDNNLGNLFLVTANMRRNTSILDSQEVARKLSKTFIPCKFQKECWKTIRAPIARKHGVFLPYICSFQTEGDLYQCSHFWNFKKKEEQMLDIEKGEKN